MSAQGRLTPSGCIAAIAVVALAMLLPARAIAQAADVNGHVTSHLTGAPLAGVRVGIDILLSPFGGEAEVGSTYTDADGFYAWSGDAVGFGGSFDVEIADPRYLPAGYSLYADGTVQSADFALVTPATATGTVHFAGGDTTGMRVLAEHFFPEAGVWGTVGVSGVAADGSYSIGSLPPEDYRFCTEIINNGAVPQCFDGVDYPPTATQPNATIVHIAEGAAIDAIDFNLHLGGALSGTIFDGFLGTPLTSNLGEVIAYDINGNMVFGAIMDPDGSFHLRGLPDGQYYLGASAAPIFSDGMQFYPGIVCTAQQCPPPTAGTLLTIAGTNEIDGLDFTFHPEIVVQGRVLDADTAAPLGGVQVGLFSAGGVPLTISAPDTGEYTFYWYADDQFEVSAFEASPHIDTVYPGVSCPGGTCIGQGSTLQATIGSVLTGIDIPMALGVVISGHITRSDNGVLASGGYVQIFDDMYDDIWDTVTLDGTFTMPAWIPGTYYAEATAFDPLTGCAFYLDIPCPADGNPADAGATPIVVAAGEVRDDIDFHFQAVDPIFASTFEYAF